MTDRLVVGAGVIGLSTAFEAVTRGATVTIVETGLVGRESSWAGAGILTPTNERTALHPLEKLRGMSSRLHEQWATRLFANTGIDNGYSKCGGVYLARTIGEIAALNGIVDEWREFEIESIEMTHEQIFERVNSISNLPSDRLPKRAFWTPGEAQIHNPSHLNALRCGCEKLGVRIVSDAQSVSLDTSPNKIHLVTAGGQKFEADSICFAAGAWTEDLLASINVALPMVPVRGQMLLYKLARRPFEPVVYEGSRYLVPRRDGHVLVGATVEEVGFDKNTTRNEIEALQNFAESLIPDLNETSFVKAWAGLRPGTFDGFPYLGRLAEFENGFVSTGHFKSGLHLSTGSAVVMVDLIEGKPAAVDLTPFDPNRVALSRKSHR